MALPSAPEQVESLLSLDRLELEVGYGLIPIVDEEQNGDLLNRIRSIRRQLALDMGLVVPPLRVRDNLQLKPGEYRILVKGNEVAKGEMMLGYFMALDPGELKRTLEGIPTKEPVFQLPALWVPEKKKGRGADCRIYRGGYLHHHCHPPHGDHAIPCGRTAGPAGCPEASGSTGPDVTQGRRRIDSHCASPGGDPEGLAESLAGSAFPFETC